MAHGRSDKIVAMIKWIRTRGLSIKNFLSLACVKPVAAMLCTGGPDVIRKEAWPFYRAISSVRLCWELEESKEPEGPWRVAGGASGCLGVARGSCRDTSLIRNSAPPGPCRKPTLRVLMVVSVFLWARHP